jgi:hypothetical protein
VPSGRAIATADAGQALLNSSVSLIAAGTVPRSTRSNPNRGK